VPLHITIRYILLLNNPLQPPHIKIIFFLTKSCVCANCRFVQYTQKKRPCTRRYLPQDSSINYVLPRALQTRFKPDFQAQQPRVRPLPNFLLKLAPTFRRRLLHGTRPRW
jgi:hypothetical protein